MSISLLLHLWSFNTCKICDNEMCVLVKYYFMKYPGRADEITNLKFHLIFFIHSFFRSRLQFFTGDLFIFSVSLLVVNSE